ncbi:hypothetical protein [Lederbergia ruris]|uniref:Uncharacterized protein n=1 Tax=Lederbergia ruris TaxID=217495 RepID=A0ABQ4KMI7_9BACI|nr:hypothetical protein [Lederbergia ruris]GIN58374.1 hypothetical protein J8TS2_26930 [Lederbergia ruris]
MKTEQYTVKNSMVYNSGLENKPINFFRTLRIYEDQHNYETEKQQDHFPYDHNVVKRAFIDVIFFKQVHQAAFARVRNDEEYLKAEENSSRLLSQLEESLMTKEQKKLLRDLESEWSHMYGIFLEHCYCQGLADSKMIHKELEKYGISIAKEASEYHYGLTQPDSSILM